MRKLLLGGLAVGIALVLLIVGKTIFDASQPTWSSGPPHEELLGVTDGADLFNDPATAKTADDRKTMEDINVIQRKIYEENLRVAEEGGAYVKVALLMPLTVSMSETSAIPLVQIKRALQGAYTALIRANTTPDFGDPGQVKVQLLLANQGSRQDVSDRFINKVLETTEEGHPLVAAVGLGSSVRNTETMAERLGREGIPMVSAITSSDTLTGLTYLWSVSPSNTHYAMALRHFLKAYKDLKSAIVVSDINKDPYTTSLAQAFRQRLSDYLAFPDLSYRGGTTEVEGNANLFAHVVTNLCNAVNDRERPLDTVLYAGRVADFEYFAKALESRQCRSHPLTVLTGATGFDYAENFAEILKNGNVKVFYASSSDALTWVRDGAPDLNGSRENFQRFLERFQEQKFQQTDLDDGLAIAHHDALAVVVMAIRLNPSVPTPDDVAAQFDNLVLAYRVPGASGMLSFPRSAQGRAVGRFIPIRTLGENTTLPPGYTPFVVE